ncbi:MAG: hypothetical protein IT158_18190 [Bryobacterales bacterium]|nr:hypothetical protein [Bryobacterales bacterium]
MKRAITACACVILLAGLCAAAAIDGKWVSERKMERDGETFTITQVFDLKAEGGKLVGGFTVTFGDREFKAEIQEGKIEGSKFSFATVMSTPNGDFKTVYEGSVEGDTLKGTAERQGGQQRPFEARRK